MTDEPSKSTTAIKIGRKTRRIVWQNIIFAMGVKVIVLLLGAGGLATMWEAVFADAGVALYLYRQHRRNLFRHAKI